MPVSAMRVIQDPPLTRRQNEMIRRGIVRMCLCVAVCRRRVWRSIHVRMIESDNRQPGATCRRLYTRQFHRISAVRFPIKASILDRKCPRDGVVVPQKHPTTLVRDRLIRVRRYIFQNAARQAHHARLFLVGSVSTALQRRGGHRRWGLAASNSVSGFVQIRNEPRSTMMDEARENVKLRGRPLTVSRTGIDDGPCDDRTSYARRVGHHASDSPLHAASVQNRGSPRPAHERHQAESPQTAPCDRRH